MTDTIVLKTLKVQYFLLIKQENIPHTPAITSQADQIEAAIKTLMAQAAQSLTAGEQPQP